ncbi:MAG: hypothetical protein F6J86_41675 [Symploca sp. SIO1B1]|nr:hypothetical protein [Symploca sp. SIO1B1]
MKTLSMVTATTAFLAVGAIGISPATAADTINFDYSGNVSGNVTASPVAELLIIPEIEALLGLDPGNIPTEYNFSESLSGSFTVLDDPAQFEDGDITIDASLFGGLFEPIPSEYFDRKSEGASPRILFVGISPWGIYSPCKFSINSR